MRDFKEFMGETKEIDRWFVAYIFITGIFVGAVLTTVWLLPSLAQ